MEFVIVEDDRATRAELIDIVQQSGDWELAGEADSLRRARWLLGKRADLWMVDLGLPDGSGLELIREVRELNSSRCKIVVITMFADEANVISAIKAGADGYLLKGTDYTNVQRALADVMIGIAPVSPAIAGHLLREVRSSSDEHHAAGPKFKLTERELEVLRSVARGFTYKEVAERQGISHHTVNDHLKAIYRKLSVKSRGEAIFQAVKAGLVDLGRED